MWSGRICSLPFDILLLAVEEHVIIVVLAGTGLSTLLLLRALPVDVCGGGHRLVLLLHVAACRRLLRRLVEYRDALRPRICYLALQLFALLTHDFLLIEI